MKNLKYVTIFTYLLILSSCQNEAIDNEEQVVDSPEIELINEEYARDIEIYKDSRIVFDNSEHNITEVLTDPVLFSYYENAYIHFLDVSVTDDTSILYVSPQDIETAEKMIAQVTEKSRLAYEALKNSNRRGGNYNFITRSFKHTNYKGRYFSWNVSGTTSDTDVDKNKVGYNVPTWIKNKASSFKYSISKSGIKSAKIQLYGDQDLQGDRSDLIKGALNIKTLSSYTVGNDNIESIGFRVTTK